MRPAAPSKHFSNADSLDSVKRPATSSSDDGFILGRHRRRPTSRRWLASRLALAGLALALLGASVPLALMRRAVSTQPPTVSPSPTLPPIRPAFVFPLERVLTSSTGRNRRAAVQEAAAAIQTTLSRFYDQVFLDPLAWKGGIPAETWDAFAASLRERAISDAESLTLADIGPQIARLFPDRSSLRVRLLLDPNGRPQAAVAEVTFRAWGSLLQGEGIEVLNEGSFLLRPGRGGWVVVGYPSATTTVQSLPPPGTRRDAAGIPFPQGDPSS